MSTSLKRNTLLPLIVFLMVVHSYITSVASQLSQYEVVAFETTDDIKCLDVRVALYGCSQYVEHFCRNGELLVKFWIISERFHLSSSIHKFTSFNLS